VTIGVFMAGAQFASGHLYSDFGARGFLLMTLMSVLALGLSLLLNRLWRGGVLAVDGARPSGLP